MRLLLILNHAFIALFISSICGMITSANQMNASDRKLHLQINDALAISNEEKGNETPKIWKESNKQQTKISNQTKNFEPESRENNSWQADINSEDNHSYTEKTFNKIFNSKSILNKENDNDSNNSNRNETLINKNLSSKSPQINSNEGNDNLVTKKDFEPDSLNETEISIEKYKTEECLENKHQLTRDTVNQLYIQRHKLSQIMKRINKRQKMFCRPDREQQQIQYRKCSTWRQQKLNYYFEIMRLTYCSNYSKWPNAPGIKKILITPSPLFQSVYTAKQSQMYNEVESNDSTEDD